MIFVRTLGDLKKFKKPQKYKIELPDVLDDHMQQQHIQMGAPGGGGMVNSAGGGDVFFGKDGGGDAAAIDMALQQLAYEQAQNPAMMQGPAEQHMGSGVQPVHDHPPAMAGAMDMEVDNSGPPPAGG